MKKTILAFMVVFLLALALVFAEEKSGTDIDTEAEPESESESESEEIVIPPELEVLQQELVGKELQGPLGKLFGNQRINFHLELDSGETVVVGLIIEKKIIKNIQIAEVSDPTLEVKTTEMVLRSALQSSAPAATLRKALKDKKITVQTYGFANKLKFKFTSGLVRIVDIFSKEEVASVVVVSREEAGMPPQDENEENNIDAVEVKETSEEEEVKETEALPEMNGPKTHTVALITGGFAVPSIEIKAGDTVSWVNDRANVVNKGFRRAMILGTQKCSQAKSGFFQPGESYSWTFNEASTCLIVDGLYTTQTMRVVVME